MILWFIKFFFLNFSLVMIIFYSTLMYVCMEHLLYILQSDDFIYQSTKNVLLPFKSLLSSPLAFFPLLPIYPYFFCLFRTKRERN